MSDLNAACAVQVEDKAAHKPKYVIDSALEDDEDNDDLDEPVR